MKLNKRHLIGACPLGYFIEVEPIIEGDKLSFVITLHGEVVALCESLTKAFSVARALDKGISPEKAGSGYPKTLVAAANGDNSWLLPGESGPELPNYEKEVI